MRTSFALFLAGPLALMLAMAMDAHAAGRHEQFTDRFVPEWHATCQVPGHAFQLIFKSKDGDPTEDDMIASILWDKGAMMSLFLKPALFVAGRLESTLPNQCDNITAVLLKTGNLLIFLRRDNRPLEDELLAILVNGKTGKPLDVMRRLGGEVGTAIVVKDQHGLRVQLIHQWDHTPTPQEPVFAVGWLRIEELNGRLVKRWAGMPP